ncbi:MAG: ATP-binding cassette domain-containing protein [Coriobacteriales bacterium]|jgi:ABC-2 type transport system ATP-binding protein|nr:ATP-binding cassette domain-containing protein [Coriobacteriales bacterium]
MIVSAKNITKKYGRKHALDDVSLGMDYGQCLGILGKNGAGKSTFIKLILGLIFPTDGEISVFGKEPGKQNHHIGFLSENLTIYPHLTAKDNLRVAALSANNQLSNNNLEEILERLSLDGNERKRAKDFSLGMKRRLQLGMATMTKPLKLVVLDEPTNGLDVNGVIWLRKYLSELKEAGTSIVMASHTLSELEENITHYVVFDRGKIVHADAWDKKNTFSLEQKYLDILDRVKL